MGTGTTSNPSVLAYCLNLIINSISAYTQWQRPEKLEIYYGYPNHGDLQDP